MKAIKLTNSLCHDAESQSKPDIVPAYEAPGKEAVMLDLAFVALGCAVIGLMIVYAVALRQL